MPCELVAVKSWTGMVASPREMSRSLIARGTVFSPSDLAVDVGFNYSVPARTVSGHSVGDRLLFTC